MLYYNSEAAIDIAASPEAHVAQYLKILATQIKARAFLVLEIDSAIDDFSVIAAFGLPLEPFNGSEKAVLAELLKSIIEKFPQPHYHAIAHGDFAKRCERLNQNTGQIIKALYFPCKIGKIYYTFIGLYGQGEEPHLSDEVKGKIVDCKRPAGSP